MAIRFSNIFGKFQEATRLFSNLNFFIFTMLIQIGVESTGRWVPCYILENTEYLYGVEI